LRALRGNPTGEPIRPEPLPELPTEPPPPPAFLSQVAAQEWERIVREMYSLRLVTSYDLNVLASYCSAFARWLDAELGLQEAKAADPEHRGLLVRATTGNLMPHPLIRVASAASHEMLNYAKQFGLTPLSRARIAQGCYEPPSKFEGLIASKTHRARPREGAEGDNVHRMPDRAERQGSGESV
jgi:P27 family predicted phage terminase small subunit